MPVAVDQVVEQAAMPGLGRGDPHLEAEPAIGVGGRLVLASRTDLQRTEEVLVAIGRAQPLIGVRPLAGDTAAMHDAVLLHLEHIGEVGQDIDLEVEADRPAAVIGDVEILVHAAREPAADDETQAARRHGAVLAEEGPVGEVDAGGAGGAGAAVQQVPRLAVGVDHPAGDQTGVEEVETLFRGPLHMAVRVGDQHGLRVVDGDLWRTDFDLERHFASNSRLGGGVTYPL